MGQIKKKILIFWSVLGLKGLQLQFVSIKTVKELAE